MTARTAGRLIGLAILLGVGGVVGYALLTRTSPEGASRAPDGAGSTIDDLVAPPSRGVVELPDQGGQVQDLIALADEAVWTRVDPQTGELRYKLEWDHLDPKDNGLFAIDNPRAWIYQHDSVIEVTAKGGEVLWPSRDREPESGRLEGGVVVQVHRLDTAGGPASSRPEMEMRTESLSFNTTFGELATPDFVTLTGGGLDAQGTGLTLRFAQDGDVPLTYLSIKSDGKVTYTEPAGPDDTAKATDTRSHSSDDQGEEATAPETEGVLTYYRAEFSDDVRVRTGAQVLEGESVQIWARMVDGKLRPQAVGTWSGAANEPDAGNSTGDKSTPPADAADESDFELAWSGPMELRVLTEVPDELAHDDVLLSVRSTGDTPVRVVEAQSGASVECLSLDYAATRRVVTLFGIGPLGVTFSMPELAQVVAGRFELDLTTGIGAIPTPGQARAIGAGLRSDDSADPEDRRRELQWSERADFRFDTTAGPVGASGQVLPKEVLFTGRVEARDGLATVRGDTVRALLGAIGGDGGSGAEPTIRRLIVKGDTSAQDSDGARISASALDVLFQTDAATGQPTPVLATAQGDVRATRGEQRLQAGMVEVALEDVGDGSGVRMSSLEARLGVEVSFPETLGSDLDTPAGQLPATIQAMGDRLTMSGPGDVIELLGAPASIARQSAQSNSEVDGPVIRIENINEGRRLTVVGPGTASHRSRGVRADEYGQFEVEWATSMVYDDREMRAEMLGDAVASAEVGDSQRHTGRGQRIIVDMVLDASGQRRMGRTVIEGGPTDDDPAQVELRRYLSEPDEAGVRPLEGLAFLEGPEIRLDAVDGILHVPGAGLILIEDRRAPEVDAEGLEGMHGTTLFEWDGQMTFDRAAGTGAMTQRARMRHRDIASGTLTELESERLDVVVHWPLGAGVQGPVTLDQATARGAVFVRHDTLQLLCDMLVYDAATGIVRAWANEGNRITVYDEKDGRNVFADAIELDVRTGAWGRISRPTGVMVPQ